MAITNGAGTAAADAVSEARKNLRPLSAITADIYRAERQNIFTTGKLLLEAKEQAGHGKWLPYLKSIGWSDRNAQLHMSVARLAAKYETIADLNAAPTALYILVDMSGVHELAVEAGMKPPPNLLPAAIERLKKSVARGDSAGQQWKAVSLTRMAIINPPETTELALDAASDAINQNCFGDNKRFKAMKTQAEAILKANPKTEEELKAVCDQHPIPLGSYANQADIPVDSKGRAIIDDDEAEDEEEEADDEDEAPAATGKEPKDDLLPRQRYMVDTFDDACGELLRLAAKASAVFTNSTIADGDLDMLGNFLKQVAAGKRKAA